MSYFNPQQEVFVAPVERRLDMVAIMRWVYVWMFFGLLSTAVTSAVVIGVEGLRNLAMNPVALLIAVFVQFGVVIALGAGMRRFSPGTSAMLFFGYSVLTGFVLSMLLYFVSVYFEAGNAMLFTAFASTAGVFGAMSLVGMTTKMDLTRMGSFLMMGLIGLIIAMFINMLVGSSALDLIISIIGVLIFTGLTAYDTQKIKQMAADPTIQSDGSLAMKISIMGALKLYLDFINLFLFILRLLMASNRN